MAYKAVWKAAEARWADLAEPGADLVYRCPICLQDDDPRREYGSRIQRVGDNPRNRDRLLSFLREAGGVSLSGAEASLAPFGYFIGKHEALRRSS